MAGMYDDYLSPLPAIQKYQLHLYCLFISLILDGEI